MWGYLPAFRRYCAQSPKSDRGCDACLAGLLTQAPALNEKLPVFLFNNVRAAVAARNLRPVLILQRLEHDIYLDCAVGKGLGAVNGQGIPNGVLEAIFEVLARLRLLVLWGEQVVGGIVLLGVDIIVELVDQRLCCCGIEND